MSGAIQHVSEDEMNADRVVVEETVEQEQQPTQLKQYQYRSPPPPSSSSSGGGGGIQLGGLRQPTSSSYAILDGVQEEVTRGTQARITVEITTLPALLGRSHEQTNPNFFGLGKIKALSRKHCQIYFRDIQGGTMESFSATGSTTETTTCRYTAPPSSSSAAAAASRPAPLPKPNPYHVRRLSGKDNNNSHDAGRPTIALDPVTKLPQQGFYVIENLGKNKIIVDMELLKQGDSIVLRNGSAIRISTFLLYFLLPSDVTYKPHRIPLLMTSEGEESSSDEDDSDDDDDNDDDREVGTKSQKKKSTTTTKKKAAAKGTTKKRPVSSAASSKASKKAKTGEGAVLPEKVVSSQSSSAMTLKERNNNMIKELEALPVAVLLARMDDAIQQNLWERKHQLIGSTICCRAVLQAAQSYDIQQELLSNGLSNIRSGTNTGTGIKNTTAYYFSAGGVSRNFIMEWVEKSSTYKRWVSQMLLNMEPRSYQASITKSLLKTGWSRTSGAGRYIKWQLPKETKFRSDLVGGTSPASPPNTNGSDGTRVQPKEKKKPLPSTAATTTKTKTTGAGADAGTSNRDIKNNPKGTTTAKNNAVTEKADSAPTTASGKKKTNLKKEEEEKMDEQDGDQDNDDDNDDRSGGEESKVGGAIGDNRSDTKNVQSSNRADTTNSANSDDGDDEEEDDDDDDDVDGDEDEELGSTLVTNRDTKDDTKDDVDMKRINQGGNDDDHEGDGDGDMAEKRSDEDEDEDEDEDNATTTNDNGDDDEKMNNDDGKGNLNNKKEASDDDESTGAKNYSDGEDEVLI